MRDLIAVLDRAYQNLRQAIFGLRALDPKRLGGLVPALAEYVGDWSEVRKIPIELRALSDEGLALAPEAEVQLIRIVHEALTNSAKHAGASRGVVTMERDGDALRVTIEDDGKGFAVDAVADDGLHFGLETMRDRAEAVGGQLGIESAPGRGTRVVIHLPLARA